MLRSSPPGVGPVRTVQRRPRRAACKAALMAASPPPTTAISVSFKLDAGLLHNSRPFFDFSPDQSVVLLRGRSDRLDAEVHHALLEFGRLHRANDVGTDAMQQVTRDARRRDDAHDAHRREARNGL